MKPEPSLARYVGSGSEHTSQWWLERGRHVQGGLTLLQVHLMNGGLHAPSGPHGAVLLNPAEELRLIGEYSLQHDSY